LGFRVWDAGFRVKGVGFGVIKEEGGLRVMHSVRSIYHAILAWDWWMTLTDLVKLGDLICKHL